MKSSAGMSFLEVLGSLAIVALSGAVFVENYSNQLLDIEMGQAALVALQHDRSLRNRIGGEVQSTQHMMVSTNCSSGGSRLYYGDGRHLLEKIEKVPASRRSGRINGAIERCKAAFGRTAPADFSAIENFRYCDIQELSDQKGQFLITEVKGTFWDFNLSQPLRCDQLAGRPGRGVQVIYAAHAVSRVRSPKQNLDLRSHSFSGRLHVPKMTFAIEEVRHYDVGY